jgi:Protein of unknown function (DUF3918)
VTEGRQFRSTKHCQTTEEVRRMNKMMTSVVALGVGVAAYNIAQRNNMMSGRQMKRMTRKVKRALF